MKGDCDGSSLQRTDKTCNQSATSIVICWALRRKPFPLHSRIDQLEPRTSEIRSGRS